MSAAATAVPQRPPRLAPLMLPLLAELGLMVTMGLIGTALAARQSDAAAAAFAMGQQVAGLVLVLLRVIGAGISVVVARQLGAGEVALAARTARASLTASAWLGAGLALAAALPASAWMALLQAPDAVAPAAADFLVWLAPVFVLEALISTQASVLRAHLQARATLVLNAVIQAVHLMLALALMPQWGLPGFALAMVLSRGLGLGLGAWMCTHRIGLPWRWVDLLTPPGAALREVLHVGVPSAAENILYRVCATATLAVGGSLGAPTLAAQAYALQLNTITLLPGLALGLSMEVLVGHAMGQRSLRLAHRRLNRALALGLVCSVAAAAAMALLGPTILRAFTRDEAVAAMALTALWWTVLLEPGRTFNLVVINGLRAAGDTRFPVLAGAVSMVVVLAGGSWLLGAHLGLGLAGVWIAYAADEWIRGLLMWWRWQGLYWVPHARSVTRRMRQAQASARA